MRPAPRRSILIIANPAAGPLHLRRQRLRPVVACLERLGCRVVVRAAGPPGDVERLARQAEPDFDVIVGAGGDGTAHQLANGLAGSDRVMAILPFGTANVLAREIGMPRGAAALAEAIACAPVVPVWPGTVGGRLFLMMASSGFDAETVAAVGPRLKRRLGPLAFLWAGLLGLCRHRPAALRVEVEGVVYAATGVVAAKGRHYAGPFVVTAEADLTRPELALVILHGRGRVALLRYAMALLRGRLPSLPDVTGLRTPGLTLSGATALPVQADGEIVGRLPVAIGVADRPLRLVWPGIAG